MANTSKDKTKMEVSTKEIAEIFGLTDRRIRQLESEGILFKISRGKFDLPKCIQGYINYIKEQSQTVEEIDLKKEKTLLTRANRMKAEMELKIIKGEVHKSEDVEQVMNDMLSSFRAQMLVIPGKAAPHLVNKTDVAVVKSVLKDYIYGALQELSDYDPNMFYSKSKSEIAVNKKGEEKNSKKGSKKNGSRKETTK